MKRPRGPRFHGVLSILETVAWMIGEETDEIETDLGIDLKIRIDVDGPVIVTLNGKELASRNWKDDEE